MNLVRISTLLCLFVFAAVMSINAYAKGHEKSKDCWQTAMTQTALDICAGKHAHNANQKMTNVYDEILKEYAKDPVFIKALKASQNAWVAYKKAQMKMMFPHADEPAYYGTALPMCEAQYGDTLTNARTVQLMQWIKGMPEGDVCAGSIKYSPNAKYSPTSPLGVRSPGAATTCHASKSH